MPAFVAFPEGFEDTFPMFPNAPFARVTAALFDDDGVLIETANQLDIGGPSSGIWILVPPSRMSELATGRVFFSVDDLPQTTDAHPFASYSSVNHITFTNSESPDALYVRDGHRADCFGVGKLQLAGDQQCLVGGEPSAEFHLVAVLSRDSQ